VKRAVLVLALLAIACRKDEGIKRDESKKSSTSKKKLIDRFPPRDGFQYLEKTQYDGNEGSAKKTDHWVALPAKDSERIVYDVETIGDPSEPKEMTRVRFGPEGMEQLGGITLGKYEDYDPPQVILPEGAHVGMHWSGKHKYGEWASTRDCEIVAYSKCESGLTSSCRTRTEKGSQKEIELRMHFCEGVGWVGYELKVRTETGKILRIWTEPSSP